MTERESEKEEEKIEISEKIANEIKGAEQKQGKRREKKIINQTFVACVLF